MDRVSGRLPPLLPDPLQLPDVRGARRRRASRSAATRRCCRSTSVARSSCAATIARSTDSRCTSFPVTAQTPEQTQGCSAIQLLGSRVAFANAELRFPLVRRFDLGLLPISLPPVDGLFFYDIGLAWSSGQNVVWSKSADATSATTRDTAAQLRRGHSAQPVRLRAAALGLRDRARPAGRKEGILDLDVGAELLDDRELVAGDSWELVENEPSGCLSRREASRGFHPASQFASRPRFPNSLFPIPALRLAYRRAYDRRTGVRARCVRPL